MRAGALAGLAAFGVIASGCGGKAARVSASGSVSGGGSGTAPAPHAIEVEVAAEASPAWCAEWQKPLAGVHVFSNGADGSLLDEAITDGAGKATLLAIDGGYASAVYPAWASLAGEMETRVVPAGIAHLHFGAPSNHTCFPASMHVHVEVPPVPVAKPVVRACDAWAEVDTATWTADLDFVKCSYDGTFMVVLSEGGAAPILSTSPKVPWVEGGSTTVSILAPPPKVDVHVLSKGSDAADVGGGYWSIDARGTSMVPDDTLAVTQAGPDVGLDWSLRAAPDLRIEMQSNGSGCQGPSWSIDVDSSVAASALTTLDPSRLALPVRDPSGAWRLEGGDLGDAVSALRRFGAPDQETWWLQILPAAAQITLPNLTLPASLQGFFPEGPEWHIAVENVDLREASGYAELVQQLTPWSGAPTRIWELDTGCFEPGG